MIRKTEDYFEKGCGRCARFETPDCSALVWAETIKALRNICLDTGLSEHLKWGQPCYMHAGRNIALIGALRRQVSFRFFQATLLVDPGGLLERSGPNTAVADMMRFTSPETVLKQKAVIQTYLREAMAYAEEGVRPTKPKRAELDLPEELIAALNEDPELASAFAALTPGRQRSYSLAIGSAKKADTRNARITKFRPKILSGKGANEY